MYYQDLSKYAETPQEVYNIGWLTPLSDFPKGSVNDSIVQKIITMYHKGPINGVRSIQPCYLCPLINEDGVCLDNDKRNILGSAEIWFPNKAKNKIYVAPDLIIHYILEHKYLPPQKFIDAVSDFDFNSDWTGEKAFQVYLQNR